MESENMVLYFAYGSNMSKRQMEERMNVIEGPCSDFPKGNFSIIRGGVLRGFRLTFNKIDKKWPGAGYANIVKADSAVEGIVYEIDDNGKKRLDCREGADKENRKDRQYFDEKKKILLEEKEVEAVIYIANPDFCREGLKPTKEYLNKLLEGKKYLSKGYFEMLKNVKTI